MVHPAAHYYPENEAELWEAAFPPISQDLRGFTAQAEGERIAAGADANTESHAPSALAMAEILMNAKRRLEGKCSPLFPSPAQPQNTEGFNMQRLCLYT